MRNLNLWLSLVLALLVAWCSSGGSSPGDGLIGSTPPAATSPTSGGLVDAFVADAAIKAYKVTSAGAQGSLLAGLVTTSATDAYALTWTPGSYAGPSCLRVPAEPTSVP